MQTQKIWFILLSILIITVFAPTASAQGREVPLLTALTETVQVRSGAALHYPAFETLEQGDTIGAIGYDAESGWWQVVSLYGSPGWVKGDEVTANEAAIQRFATPPQAITPVQAIPPDNSNSTIVFQTATGGAIYAMDETGGNLRYLTTGLDPALSPDGQWVAFARWETGQDGALGSLWLINVDGTGERLIHEYVYNPRSPVWSADGSQIVISHQHGGYVQARQECSSRRPPRKAYDVEISRDDDGDILFCYTLPPDPHWGLRLVDLATGQHQDLPGDLYSLSPAWDPNYSPHLVYDGDRGLVNLDLAENRTWPLTEDFNDHSPLYSPDGSQIALTYRQDDHWEIHVMDADGGNRHRLTRTDYNVWAEQELSGQPADSYSNVSPAWSPDGRQLVFMTDRSGQWEIWLMEADGSNQRPLLSASDLGQIVIQYNGRDERMLAWR